MGSLHSKIMKSGQMPQLTGELMFRFSFEEKFSYLINGVCVSLVAINHIFSIEWPFEWHPFSAK